MRYVTISSTSQNKTYTLTVYATNTQYTWATVDLMRRCVTEGIYHKNGVVCQYGDYGKSRRKQSLESGLEMLTRILGSQREWISCWISWKKPIRTNTVRLDTTNGNIFLCFYSRLME